MSSQSSQPKGTGHGPAQTSLSSQSNMSSRPSGTALVSGSSKSSQSGLTSKTSRLDQTGQPTASSQMQTLGHSSSSTYSKGSAASTPSTQPKGSEPTGSTHSNGVTQTSPSSQTTMTSPTTSQSLVSTGNSTVLTPATTPAVVITEGAPAVMAMALLGVGILKSFGKAQQQLDTLSQSNTTNATVVPVLGILAGAYTSLGIFAASLPKINPNSLPQDAKPIIQGIGKSIPQIQKGTQDTIDDLTKAISDPKNVNMDGIHKAQQSLGKQGSVTQQVEQAFKQLTDWKPPKGIGDITLPNSITLPSPTIGDNWKGTSTKDTLTVPSPSVNWDKPSSSSSYPGSSIMELFKGLAQQASDAVTAAASSVTLLSGLASASSNDFYDLVGLFTSAIEGQFFLLMF